MSTDDLRARAHANLGAFVRLQGHLHGGAVLDEPGIVAFRTPVDFPATRLAVPGTEAIPPAAFAARVEEFLLDDGGSTAAVQLPADDAATMAALAAIGFAEFSQSPEMVCDPPLADRPVAEGITLRLGDDAADVRAYAEVAGHAFRHLSIPEEITRDTIDRPDIMLADDVVIALAERAGQVVAGASGLLVPGTGGAYVAWVACHDDARGLALGDAVTRRLTRELFDRGATFASLEASRFGASTYARMGYVEHYRYATMIRF